jgi:hypothetical protein
MTDFAQLLDHLKTLDPVLIGLGPVEYQDSHTG